MEHQDKSWISLILLTKYSQFSRDISTFSPKVVIFSTTVQLLKKFLDIIIKFFLSGVIVKNNHFVTFIFQCVNLLFKTFVFIWNKIYCNFFIEYFEEASESWVSSTQTCAESFFLLSEHCDFKVSSISLIKCLRSQSSS